MTARAPWLAFLAASAAKVAFAGATALLADEAYYWVWSRRPALGYYDQPPMIAWLIAATTALLGDGELAVRLGAIACGAVGATALLPFARDRALHLLWWAGLAPLVGLTLFATADAPLLGGWAVALAAACRGGRWWLLAGLGAGVAFLSKYSGLAVLPLLVLAAGPRDWRTPWPWLAFGVLLACAAPNLAWNASHGWVSFAFQLREGLVNERAPGAYGVLAALGEQLAFTGGLAYAAYVGAAVTLRPRSWADDRALRLAWATSVPVSLLFLAAAPFAPSEAHWAAPALIGGGLLVAAATGPVGRLGRVGAWLAALLTAGAAVHVFVPVVRLTDDPAVRLSEGPLVADGVAAWALPEGATVGDPVPIGTLAVYTERYQEAAFVHYYAGIPARRLPGCGRDDEYGLTPAPIADRAVYVRPTRSGPAPECLTAVFADVSSPRAIAAPDPRGRRHRGWQLFEVAK